jgi:NOL1/NOP2/fmu family ribosome biogenesis protein
MQKENILAIHARWSNDVALLQKNLYLRKAGINAGAIKGNELVPHHELALSTIANNTIPKTEISSAQALQYLRKREIEIETNYKGWVLCTFNNYPLGWVKILHNRVNNYYPTEWRILKD